MFFTKKLPHPEKMRQSVDVESLPDVASVSADHFLAGFATERFGEIRTILQRAIRAVLTGRMGIGLGQ